MGRDVESMKNKHRPGMDFLAGTEQMVNILGRISEYLNNSVMPVISQHLFV